MTIKKTYSFQSEVKQLLKIMIHSLYSNKEIFLRELISNASDAADKLRFRALSNPDIYENDTKLRVRISIDNNNRIISISDNGIGMTNSEVITNLGTIAKSGTKEFLESISNTSQYKDNKLIGQFGVGFYSVFMVANKVVVKTRAAGENVDSGTIWESTGDDEYSISNLHKVNRGTEVILYLKEEENEFLDSWRVRNIVNKYSNYIPISVEIEKKDKDGSVIWERINKSTALWIRNKTDISDDEYKDFYKQTFNDVNEPLYWSHNTIEGTCEYTSLLYIPSKASWDTWSRDYKHGLKLYVKRVFIIDNIETIIPNYLRFVRGIVDSSSLSLNVSREIIQNNNIIKSLRNNITKRTLQILDKLSNQNIEKYQIFWNQFGVILKEGLSEDQTNINVIAKLLRFSSTKCKNNEQSVSLKDYTNRMIDGQEKIYFITADNYLSAKNSPHIEFLCKKNIEVLLLYDRIDEWAMNYLTEFNGKKLQLVSKIDESLSKLINISEFVNDEKWKTLKNQLEPFVNRAKVILNEKVKDVRLTQRLIETPAAVITDTNEVSTQMAKLFALTGQTVPEIKYIFEINPNHSLIKYVASIKEEHEFSKWINMLLEQAIFIERGMVEDPNTFIKNMNQILLSKILY